MMYLLSTRHPTGRIGLVGLLFGSLVMPSLAAQDAADAKSVADAKIVQPFLRPTTFLILKVDLSGIHLDNLVSTVKTISPETKAAYADVFQVLGASSRQLGDLVDGQPIFATMGIPVSTSQVPVRLFVRKTSHDSAEKIGEFLKKQGKVDVTVAGDYLVATPTGFNDDRPTTTSSSIIASSVITEAFQSVEGYPAQLLVVPPEHVWRTVKELSPALPRHLGGGPSRVLTEGVQWAAFGIDPARLRTMVVIQSASEGAARELAAQLPTMLRSASNAVPESHNQLPVEFVQTLIDWLKPVVEGSRVTIRIDGQEKTNANLTLLAGIAQAIEDKTRTHNNQQRLKQILLGMHNYHDKNKSFPPADKYRGADGKHYLSWRVHILPYIGESKLYSEFRLGEPWDSPHNSPLITKMPEIYASFNMRSRITTKPGHTMIQAPVGEKTIFGGVKSTKFDQITDGTTNTIAVVVVTPDRAVPWTAPADFVFDAQNPLNGILRGADGRWLCAFADGSVRQIARDIPNQTVLRLFQMNDGHSIDDNELR